MKILFVCTGNTCRSPLAEALCKRLLADRLSCEVADLPARGFEIQSAGLAAYPGDIASPASSAAAAERGGDLSAHQSRRLTPEILDGCHRIVTVTNAHRVILESLLPADAPRPELLCGTEDLDDPIGQDIETYRVCAAKIHHHLGRLLGEWGLV